MQSVSDVSCMQSGVTCRVSVMSRACRVVSRAEWCHMQSGVDTGHPLVS